MMSKLENSTEPQQNDVLLKIDPRIAQDLERMSKELDTTPANLLATLVWLGKKAFGREIKIESKGETQTLNIKTFADLEKIEPLDN